MEKWLCFASMGTASGLLALFILDMVISFPFGGLSFFVDVIGVTACAIVAYLGFDAFKDLR